MVRKGKYVCKQCKQAKEEVWILGEAIEQVKVELGSMLSEVASKLGIGEWLLKRNELKIRIDIMFCNYQMIEADDRNELIRMVKNYIPFELNKRIRVYSDRVEVHGMTADEVMDELDVRSSDWLGYAYA